MESKRRSIVKSITLAGINVMHVLEFGKDLWYVNCQGSESNVDFKRSKLRNVLYPREVVE